MDERGQIRVSDTVPAWKKELMERRKKHDEPELAAEGATTSAAGPAPAVQAEEKFAPPSPFVANLRPVSLVAPSVQPTSTGFRPVSLRPVVPTTSAPTPLPSTPQTEPPQTSSPSIKPPSFLPPQPQNPPTPVVVASPKLATPAQPLQSSHAASPKPNLKPPGPTQQLNVTPDTTSHVPSHPASNKQPFPSSPVVSLLPMETRANVSVSARRPTPPSLPTPTITTPSQPEPRKPTPSSWLSHNKVANREKVVCLQRQVRVYLSRQEFLKRKKRRTQRNALVKELLTSERSYVESLAKVHTYFVEPLLWNASHSRENAVLSEPDVAIAFGNVSSIYQLNKELLESLEERIGRQWSHHQLIGDILEKHVPFMRMYSVYCDKFEKAQEHLSLCKDKYPLFRTWLTQVDQLNNLDLSSLLIMPVQRLPRYKLLLEDICRCTDESHPDFESLRRALQTISRTAAGINRFIKESDRHKRVMFLGAKMRGLGEDLVQPHRTLLLEGVARRQNDPVYLVLCSDIVVLLDELDVDMEQVLNVKFKIELQYARVKDLPDSVYLQDAFQLVGRDRTHIIVCFDASQKDTWLDILEETINHARAQSLRRISTSIDTEQSRVRRWELATSQKYITSSLRECVVRIDGSMIHSDAPKAFTLYLLTCITDFGYEFRLHKRYSDFDALYSQLKKKQANLPKLPPRYMLRHKNLSDQVRGERQVLLDQFLQDLVLHEDLQTSQPLLLFLSLTLCQDTNLFAPTPTSSSSSLTSSTGPDNNNNGNNATSDPNQSKTVSIVMTDASSFELKITQETRTNELLRDIRERVQVPDPYLYRVHILTPTNTTEVTLATFANQNSMFMEIAC
eukprot:c5461_g1_i2.p1 GENE.c5461_g1_i2~~c5461_g1_i2.p1  ORF type:complete len:893 (+),score=242.14 c5461_g1_i2:137-2680(+)